MKGTLVFAFLALALASSVEADEPRGIRWAEGDLVQVEFESKGSLSEQAEGERSTSTHSLRLVYVDRVDTVRDGRVVAITRHVVRAEFVEDRQRARELGLVGRSVVLQRDREGRMTVAWASGGRVTGAALDVVQEGPWPDMDAGWRLDLGTRRGELNGVTTARWKPRDLPQFVPDAVHVSGLDEIRKGSWKLSLKRWGKQQGHLQGEVRVEGHEGDLEDDVKISLSVQLSVRRSRSPVKELPEDLPPLLEPEDEPEEEGGDLDMDDYEDEDGDEDHEEGEDEETPIPAPDEPEEPNDPFADR